MTLTINSISPQKVAADGGARVEVEGDFENLFDVPFRVHVGPTGDDSDPACYSGIVGQGTVVYPVSATKLVCYLPVLEPTLGTPYHVFVIRTDTLDDGELLDSLEVLPRQYFSRVFELRSVFPRFYRMGPRNMESLEKLP